MRTERDILIKPIMTEKSLENSTLNKYTFQVDTRANKIEIRKAVEKIFNVKVTKVNTLMVRGKKRRRGRYEGVTPNWKKAIVTLKKGHRIEIGGVDFFEH